MASSSKPAHLEPSKLGTKEYWDNLYTVEIKNHTEDPSDTGTVWFDDSDAEDKILNYLLDLTTDSSSSSNSLSETGVLPLSQEETSFLDLGCGNGSLLFSLRGESWSGRMLGVDYSEKSISLAKQIQISASEEASSRDGEDDPDAGGGGGSGGSNIVEFSQWDIIHGSSQQICSGKESQGWDVVLDKGTFDAISLSQEVDERGVRLSERYKGQAEKLVRKGGIFLVTSCNWTEEELRAWFEGDEFAAIGKVDYPTFSFGGAKGQTISTLCFQRR